MNLVLLTMLVSVDPTTPTKADTEPTPIVAPWDVSSRLDALEKDVATLKRENAELKAKVALCPCPNPQMGGAATSGTSTTQAFTTVCQNGACYQVPVNAAANGAPVVYASSGGCANGQCGMQAGSGGCSSGECGGQSSGKRGRRGRR